jgi:hypothetical protein
MEENWVLKKRSRKVTDEKLLKTNLIAQQDWKDFQHTVQMEGRPSYKLSAFNVNWIF